MLGPSPPYLIWWTLHKNLGRGWAGVNFMQLWFWQSFLRLSPTNHYLPSVAFVHVALLQIYSAICTTQLVVKNVNLFHGFSHHAGASTCLTLTEVENELSEVTATDWYPLGVQLGLRPPTLREIQKNYPHDTEQCRREMLDLWLRSTPQASWKSLAQAVQALGRYTSLAQKLRRKVPLAQKG